jgi:hypothetical protein
MTTEEALQLLAKGRVRHVCLIKPGHFAVLVTYESQRQEFIFAEPWRLRQRRRTRSNRPISVVEILFQTTPRLFDLVATA